MCSICYLCLTVTRLSSQSLGKSMFPFSCCRSLMAVILSVSLSRPLSCPLHPLPTTPTPTPSSLSRSLMFILNKSGLRHPMSPKSWSQSHAVLIPMGSPPPPPPPPQKKKKKKIVWVVCCRPKPPQITTYAPADPLPFFVSYVIPFVPPCPA